MKKKFTLPISDLKDWQEYTRSPKDIYDKDQDNQSRKKNILKYKFDLHGYSLNDANKKVSEIINFCSEKNYSEILLITGKGLHSQNEKDPYVSKELGILKNSVPEFVKNNDKLMSMISDIQSANIEDGGSGAFYIFLKKKI